MFKTEYEKMVKQSEEIHKQVMDNIQCLCSEVCKDCECEIVESDKNEHEIQTKSDN